jgi:tRNA 2-thiocytidine biosynthesis protein TtcA
VQTDNTFTERDLRRRVGEVIGRYSMLGDGDRVLVAISGGKDSLVMLDVLLRLQRRAPVRYELVPFTLDPGFPGFDTDAVRRQVARLGAELVVEPAPIAGILESKRANAPTLCPLCSRLRRGHLYAAAPRHRCNKIALGHHADDLIENLLLNLFFTGQLAGMPPVLRSDDGRNTVIRPLCHVYESEVTRYFAGLGLAAVPSACPEKNLQRLRRHWVKELLADLERHVPRIRNSALAAMANVRERFLMDPRFLDRL